ncbi:MAG: FAD-binding oxidoreductase [Nitrosopumilaceae archaeon]|nr:FAD-binding oxidoreductase [Nitrosopumilaceae archaeon]
MRASEIKKRLQKIISCDIHLEKEFTSFYSVDASSYQIKPLLVIIPNNTKEITEIVKFATKNKISVTVRGAGTGLVGSALNSGIIFDMKNFNEIKVAKTDVTVGPGVQKGVLDKILKSKKKFLGPNPSIGSYCSIGGMIGNNSSGSRTLKYGSVIDNLKEISFVDGNGQLIQLPQNKKYAQKVLEISKKIDLKKFPNVSKNSCGYRLDKIKSIKDTPKIIAGSEGTLGIMVSAKLKIQNIPKQKKLFVIEYTTENTAAKECPYIYRLNPSAIEFVDKKTLDNIDFKFSKNAKCLLFVEFDSNITKSEKLLKKIISGRIVKSIKNDLQIQKWWKYRDSALYYSLKSIKKENRIPHIIEDATVSLELLPKLFFTIKKINQIFNTDSVFYGHAGNGNIHVRLIAGRQNPKKLEKIAAKYFDQVISMGGTITGEHGDGLARSQFVKKQYGNANYITFRQLKAFFDPKNILNPDKIISSKNTVLKNLEKF